jgi:hypothetical protein
MDMEIQQVPWWNRRSRMERRFIVTTISLIFVSVGLAVGLAGVVYKKDIFHDGEEDPKSLPGKQLHTEEIQPLRT